MRLTILNNRTLHFQVTYQETESQESVFSSRVLCLPLLTVLLAADAPRAQYVLLGGNNALPALTHLPFDDDRLHLQVRVHAGR